MNPYYNSDWIRINNDWCIDTTTYSKICLRHYCKKYPLISEKWTLIPNDYKCDKCKFCRISIPDKVSFIYNLYRL